MPWHSNVKNDEGMSGLPCKIENKFFMFFEQPLLEIYEEMNYKIFPKND